jgi:galactose mutarotase-like enzyme
MKSTVLFQNQPVRELRAGEDRVLVAPGHGARVLRWEHAGREVIHWPDSADWTRVIKVRGGDPVLFPFVARHFVDGVNERWRDASGRERPMPMHGFARDAAFDVIEHTETTLRMRLADSAATRDFYPFAFQFDVVVILHPGSRLEMRFETSNPGLAPLPYYAGHHFYLAIPHDRRADWTLHLPCAAWGRQAPDGSIVREEAASADLRLDDISLVDRFQIEPRTEQVRLENAAAGSRLVIELPGAGDLAPWYAVTTWTEKPDSDFYCVEPWLGLPNAIHHGEGLRHVAPGTTESASCVLDASAW